MIDASERKGKDGALMVLIPAGGGRPMMTMGYTTEFRKEKPQHIAI